RERRVGMKGQRPDGGGAIRILCSDFGSLLLHATMATSFGDFQPDEISHEQHRHGGESAKHRRDHETIDVVVHIPLPDYPVIPATHDAFPVGFVWVSLKAEALANGADGKEDITKIRRTTNYR